MGVHLVITYTRTATLIVTASDQSLANEVAAGIDPDTGGVHTFEVPLSATGAGPATHFAAHTAIRPATLEEVEILQVSTFPDGYIFRDHNHWDAEPEISRYSFDEAISSIGLQVIREEVP